MPSRAETDRVVEAWGGLFGTAIRCDDPDTGEIAAWKMSPTHVKTMMDAVRALPTPSAQPPDPAPGVAALHIGFDPLEAIADWEDAEDIANAVAQAAFAHAELRHAAAIQAEAERVRGIIAEAVERHLDRFGIAGVLGDEQPHHVEERESQQALLDLVKGRTLDLGHPAPPERAYSEEKYEAMRARKDAAYKERNRVVAAFAFMAAAMGWRVGIRPTKIDGWSADWHGCVWIDSPAGQMSWHYHDSHAGLFADLPVYDGPEWDGHTTPEKYERLAGLRPERTYTEAEVRAVWERGHDAGMARAYNKPEQGFDHALATLGVSNG